MPAGSLSGGDGSSVGSGAAAWEGAGFAAGCDAGGVDGGARMLSE
jgi:hypothetical protein